MREAPAAWKERFVTQPDNRRVLHVVNPFETSGTWLKGGLHVHTTDSDGAFTPEETLRRYRGHGYDFLGISDHDVVTVPASVPDGMIWIPAVEYATSSNEGVAEQWHVVSVRTQKCLAVRGYPVKTILLLLREVSPFTILAHPYWSNQGGDDLLKLPEFPAVEVFNYGSERELERGHAEYLWDYMLSAGRRVWGVASDDSHHPEDVGRAWLMVRAQERTCAGIIEALRAGMFYSSSGPEFLGVEVKEEGVKVRTTAVQSISFLSDRMLGTHYAAEPGASLTEASYTYRGNETYLRAQARDAEGRGAWTNLLCSWETVSDESEATSHDE